MQSEIALDANSAREIAILGEMKMKQFLIAAAAAAALCGAPALADAKDEWQERVDNGEDDIGFGIGLTWAFGAKSARSGLSVGVKAFSSKKSESFVASVGLDYNLSTQGLRPNFGVAYLATDAYFDVNYGYDFGASNWGFGLGTGYAETARDTYITHITYHN